MSKDIVKGLTPEIVTVKVYSDHRYDQMLVMTNGWQSTEFDINKTAAILMIDALSEYIYQKTEEEKCQKT